MVYLNYDNTLEKKSKFVPRKYCIIFLFYKINQTDQTNTNMNLHGPFRIPI